MKKLLFIVLIGLFTSCDETYLYEHYTAKIIKGGNSVPLKVYDAGTWKFSMEIGDTVHIKPVGNYYEIDTSQHGIPAIITKQVRE